MSRLYLNGKSDAGETPITARAHNELALDILWGSKENPLTLAQIKVNWPKDAKFPTIEVMISAVANKNVTDVIYP